MITKLVEVYDTRHYYSKEFSLREVYVNPDHVVAMRPDNRMVNMLTEGRLPDELDERQKFTLIHMDRGHSGIDVTVVGDVELIREKLFNSKKLLKG